MPQLTPSTSVWEKVKTLSGLASTIGDGPLVDYIDLKELHIALNAFNHVRLHPGLPSKDWESNLPTVHAAELIEARFVEEERQLAATYLDDLPQEPSNFIVWFEELMDNGPGQYDPFFDYLAKSANHDEMKYFITQEYCGEIGFDDLIALTQVRFPVRAKMELARNFWDEQGQGKLEDVHGPLYVAMAHEIGAKDTQDSEFLWESLAVANLLTALAVNRRYAWHSLGALSVIEMTSPTRASRVAEGLERLGLSANACRYFQLHCVVDVDHWKGWLAEVFQPLLTESPELIRPIAEGAFLRLVAGERLINRYRTELNLEEKLQRFS